MNNSRKQNELEYLKKKSALKKKEMQMEAEKEMQKEDAE